MALEKHLDLSIIEGCWWVRFETKPAHFPIWKAMHSAIGFAAELSKVIYGLTTQDVVSKFYYLIDQLWPGFRLNSKDLEL